MVGNQIITNACFQVKNADEDWTKQSFLDWAIICYPAEKQQENDLRFGFWTMRSEGGRLRGRLNSRFLRVRSSGNDFEGSNLCWSGEPAPQIDQSHSEDLPYPAQKCLVASDPRQSRRAAAGWSGDRPHWFRYTRSASSRPLHYDVVSAFSELQTFPCR
jgi:hypothetical protein